MKKLITIGLMLFSIAAQSQSLTVTSPAGLSEPYEVAAGTEVTVTWDYFSSSPSAMFSHDTEPDLASWGFYPNSEWTSHSDFSANGDGTYNWSFTVNDDVYLFGGFQTFFDYTYSNVIHFTVLSGLSINYDDGLICDGEDEILSAEGTWDSYQWYLDAEMIEGATSSSYTAAEAGNYHLVATSGDDEFQSNTLVVSEQTLDFTGELNGDATEITMTATAGMDTYQWYGGSDPSDLSMIDGETSQTYTAMIDDPEYYYSVEAGFGACMLEAPVKAVYTDIFVEAVIQVNADTNSFGNVCEGTVITLSIDTNIENYSWYKNGNFYSSVYSSLNLNSAWAMGEYHVETSPADWPEIVITSEAVTTEYFSVDEPVLYGNNESYYCAGDEISLILVDEGYTYDWYLHSDYNYTEDDLITVDGGSYTFTYDSVMRVSVVANYQGCESGVTEYFNSYSSQYLYVSLGNYDQRYLCTDSSANLAVTLNEENFVNYQWYMQDGDDWNMISGEETNAYDATEAGVYKVIANSAFCESAEIESSGFTVYDYSERPLNLYAWDNEICLGDTATISFNGYSWQDIQWLEGDIVMGSQGYERIFLPIPGAGTDDEQDVMDFNRYIVKARHQSCPNGLKITSNEVQVKPFLNPEVIVGDSGEDYNYHRMALWDSAAFYISCIERPIRLRVEEDIYDSYQWHELGYAGIDDYELGDAIDGATDSSYITTYSVQWSTVEVELDGCIGYSDPVMLDAWAFLPPAVQSYNNNEICPGDSALVNLGFPGTWVEYYWTLDGDSIPNSNNDSLWVTEPGTYVINAFPEACPDFEYSSGLGPTLTLFEATIEEGEDEFGNQYFYAFPWQGVYEYQWFLDGEPIEGDPDIPAILWKDGLEAGVITVEITNPEPCVAMSDGFVWDPIAASINENVNEFVSIYPNPSTGTVNIDGLNEAEIKMIEVYSPVGKLIHREQVINNRQQIDISNYANGVYYIKLQDNHGNIHHYNIQKM